MKIAYLTPTPPAISETFITDEVQWMEAEFSHSIELVALAVSADEGARLRSVLESAASFTRFAIRRPIVVARLLREIPTLAELPRWVRLRVMRLVGDVGRLDVDHLHVHFVDQTAVAGLAIGRVLGLPVTATAHARDIFFTPDHWFTLLSRGGLTFVAVCRYNKRELLHRGVPHGQVAVIPCGTELIADESEVLNLDGRLRILVIGRLVPKKGIDDLLLALINPEIAALVDEVRVIGSGPELSRLERLAEDARSAGVEIRFLGALDRSLHEEHYQWANLSCLACKVAADGDRDSMPVAIKESLARALPVLTTSEVGIPEMVDATTAVLVAPDSVEALGAGLRQYADLTSAERRSLGVAGRSRMRERFGLRATTGALDALIVRGVVPTQWDGEG